MPTYVPGEAPVCVGEANYDDKYTGRLYLTNRRLCFEHRKGLIRKRVSLDVEILLKDITSTAVEKGPWNWIVLVVAAGNQKHRFLFRDESPDVLAKRIGELMASQSTAPA